MSHSRCGAVLTALRAVAALTICSTQALAQLSVVLGDNGLTALRYGDVDLLSKGDFLVTGAFFRKWDGEVYAGDLSAGQLRHDPANKRLTWAYPWGEVAATYAPDGSRLNLSVDIATRRDAHTLVAIYLQFAELKFPSVPQITNRSFFFYARTNMAHNIGAPGFVCADYGQSMLALCNEDVGRPLSFGFGDSIDGNQKLTYPVLAFTGRHPMLKEKWPFIDRPIYPGGVDHYDLSLRFGPADAPVDELVGDLYQKFAVAYPFKLSWEDRRPIGRLFLSSSHAKLEENYPTNPRGWFNDRKIDVTTPQGMAAFQERLLKWADNAVKITTAMNAQGVLLWDPEGQENPHMISYLGDPRSLPPEMEPVADEFFKRFRDAGLRTGICIRPQRPVRMAYTDRVFQQTFVDRRDRMRNLSEKIETARKRWGCTLFYLDSNVDFYGDPVAIPDAGGYSAMVDDDLLQQLAAKYPDSLFMPEWENLRTYAYTAPYSQLDYNKLVAPPQYVLRTYPKAFLVNMVGEKEADQYHAELVQAVKRGDILFFSGWWPSPENPKIKSIYEEGK